MHITPKADAWATLMAADRPGPVQMLNLVRYRDGGAATYAAYGRATAPIFARVGGRIVWTGQVEQVVIGPAEERWDLAFVAEYPGLAAFQAMLSDPDYQHASALRDAALADSRLIRLGPMG
ncbi:MAG: DUF1330 domain-containing protein [Pseudomonadota bacterium]